MRQVFLNGVMKLEGRHFDYVWDGDIPVFNVDVDGEQTLVINTYDKGLLVKTMTCLVGDTKAGYRLNWWLPRAETHVRMSLLRRASDTVRRWLIDVV